MFKNKFKTCLNYALKTNSHDVIPYEIARKFLRLKWIKNGANLSVNIYKLSEHKLTKPPIVITCPRKSNQV